MRESIIALSIIALRRLALRRALKLWLWRVGVKVLMVDVQLCHVAPVTRRLIHDATCEAVSCP